MCMRSKAWLAASVSLRLARLPSLQAGFGTRVAYAHACGCARPSCACFGHKTVKAGHIQRRCVLLTAGKEGLKPSSRSTWAVSYTDEACMNSSGRQQIRIHITIHREIKPLGLGYCDSSARSTDWRFRSDSRQSFLAHTCVRCHKERACRIGGT